MNMQSVIRAIYPPQCVACGDLTDSEQGLCGPCRRDAHFIDQTICDTCGAPLPGDSDADDLQCDDCMRIARPWDRGRAALVYSGTGRRLVLGLKHGDRTDLAQPAARWMARKVKPLLKSNTVLVPVPLHRFRLARRRYNQAALLGHALAKLLNVAICPDALLRPVQTKPLEGHSRDARFTTLADAITPNPKRVGQINGKAVLLVDDVMTSGATLAVSAEASRAAGAANVSIVTLARVVKDA